MNCSCGEPYPEEGKYCRKCGSPLVNSEASTELMEQTSMHAKDILIVIKSVLREKFGETKGNSFVVTYADFDREHNLPSGSTAQYIEKAVGELANEMNIKIDIGSTRAELSVQTTTTHRPVYGERRY